MTSAPHQPGFRGTGMSPRALTLAASIAWRHAAADPVRAIVLAQRVLPRPLRGGLRLAGPYGRAAVLWGAGDRAAALAALQTSPRRLAAFSLAVDQPETAAAALSRLPDDDRARPVLAARLAWREGRLTEAIDTLGRASGIRARRLRTRLTAERAVLAAEPGNPMIMNSFGQIAPVSVHDHESTRTPGRVLHIVNDALPTTSAGYTIRTHEIVLAQRAAGLDPHVVTRCGFPVTQGTLDARRLVTLDGIPYHRLLPWRMPARADKAAALGLELAERLTEQIKPSVLHAASNYVNAVTALSLGKSRGLPVVYEVRGFWEDTWLSRHPDSEKMASSELYRRNRDLETRCMQAADLVVTLGEAMREEIVARGVPAEKVLIVPNAVSDDFLQPLPDPQKLREELGIKPNEHVVGEVSSLVPHEGIGTLLEATRLLKDRGLPVRALIVGDGPERLALQRQAADLGLGEAAIFTGRVPAAKVREFHALLDVFVVPRTPDRVCQLVTPLKPVEAMASGLCVVTSDVRALAEIIKPDVTGALTIPQDPVALADSLELLVCSPDIRRKLGDNAREWVARDRTWAHNAVRYRDAYARLG
ncbi:MAG TPA: glycosyltransferase family 4 protein, partial [Streptosporangiaceae bacterium]|nr:glycosyltransferase family 4 protein [Streptosporangiaceae bacterium]